MDSKSAQRLQQTFQLDLNARQLETKDETKNKLWKFVYETSPSLNQKLGSHGAGHADITVNSATGAFVLLGLIFIVLSTLYMAYRVYRANKFLTESWLKDKDHINPGDPRQKEDQPMKEGKMNKSQDLELSGASKKGKQQADEGDDDYDHEDDDDDDDEEAAEYNSKTDSALKGTANPKGILKDPKNSQQQISIQKQDKSKGVLDNNDIEVQLDLDDGQHSDNEVPMQDGEHMDGEHHDEESSSGEEDEGESSEEQEQNQPQNEQIQQRKQDQSEVLQRKQAELIEAQKQRSVDQSQDKSKPALEVSKDNSNVSKASAHQKAPANKAPADGQEYDDEEYDDEYEDEEDHEPAQNAQQKPAVAGQRQRS